jgi:MerR family redox-sensitive transcriptional activator SoxR
MTVGNDNLMIGEVARRVGVAASTLRHWESVGLLAAPERVAGRRRYDAEAVRRISLILLIKRAGFTLAETRVVLAGLSARTPPPEVWRELAERKLPEIVQTLAEAAAMRQILEAGLRCECLTLDECLRRWERTAAPSELTTPSARRPDPRETGCGVPAEDLRCSTST